MKQRSKKGFSLIELIVVIAVIAAIAAVIVPQFSNISGAAKNSADQRNCQLWNETYLNAIAVDAGMKTSGNVPTNADVTPGVKGTGLAKAIDVTYSLSGQPVRFSCPGFNVVGDGSISFDAANGLKYSK